MGPTHAISQLRIGLAAVRNVPSVAERLQTVDRFLEDAAAQEVAIVYFPETYILFDRSPDHRRGSCARSAAAAFAPPTVPSWERERRSGV